MLKLVKYPRLNNFIKNIIYFPISLENRKSNISMPAGSMSGEYWPLPTKQCTVVESSDALMRLYVAEDHKRTNTVLSQQ